MSVDFVVANPSGEIMQSGISPEDLLPLYANNGNQSIKGKGTPESNYVYDGVILIKESQTTAIDKSSVLGDGIDKIILSNTPVGSTIMLGTLTETSDGTDIELTFDIPGTYALKVELFPYLPFEATIDAT